MRSLPHTKRNVYLVLDPDTFVSGFFLNFRRVGMSLSNNNNVLHNRMIEQREIATLGAGCFWCVEAVFQKIRGVELAQSGYSGGHIKNPGYREVCTGRTGHAEVVQVTFDPKVVSYAELLRVFFTVHDPTTLNRQGGDVGTQYRSAIFYHSEAQREVAEKAKIAASESGDWSNPIVTEITPFEVFYPAEDYHNNYFNLNGDQPYCAAVVRPKVEKFTQRFNELLK